MTLWDILDSAQYFQQFTVYVTNAYDQNVLIGRGTRAEMLVQESEGELDRVFGHLMDKVEYFSIKNSRLIIFLRDEHYNEQLEVQYSEEYVKHWNTLDPSTRPFLYGIETEQFRDVGDD